MKWDLQKAADKIIFMDDGKILEENIPSIFLKTLKLIG